VVESLRTVALLARPPGLLVLRDALLDQPDLDLVCVFTQGRLPKAEGGGVPPDLDRFRELCQLARIPLQIVDGPQAKDIGPLLPTEALDLMVSLSWRYLVPPHVLHRFRLGCVNLHRGALPTYAGAIPVQRALSAGERRIAITAHEMIEEVDAGEKIAEVWVDVAPLGQSDDVEARAERVKAALEPLYAPLARLALRAKLFDAGP